MTAKHIQETWDKLRQERDELAEQVEVMRDALTESRRIVAEDFNDLGPCDHSVGICYCDMQRSIRNSDDALALPNTAAVILHQRDARTAANALHDYVKTIPGGSIIDPQWIADDMRRTADELVASFAAVFARIDAERGKDAVAWFVFADSNGPVPMELWGFDIKACKYAVLENARSVGWKGTIEGYLLHMSWTILPLFLSPTIPEGMELVPTEPTSKMIEAGNEGFRNPDSRRHTVSSCYKAMIAAAQGERNAD